MLLQAKLSLPSSKIHNIWETSIAVVESIDIQVKKKLVIFFEVIVRLLRNKALKEQVYVKFQDDLARSGCSPLCF